MSEQKSSLSVNHYSIINNVRGEDCIYDSNNDSKLQYKGLQIQYTLKS